MLAVNIPIKLARTKTFWNNSQADSDIFGLRELMSGVSVLTCGCLSPVSFFLSFMLLVFCVLLYNHFVVN